MSSLEHRLREALAPDYRVERELARGGSAVVYVATDAALQRPVAIKVLRPELATARGAARFLREARLLAQVTHPGVVPVHRAGEAGGLFYYVMDHVEGATLRQRLARDPLPVDEAVALGRDLLDALAAVHAAGVVHRDVKPENILLLEGRPLLADFGIAREADALGVAAEGPGTLGTPGYMAPEQAEGGDATPAGDLYAAGTVLYEALTGRKWRLSVAPGDVDWSGVPSSLVPALRRALAPDPASRWPDALSFRDALAPARARLHGSVRWTAVAALILTVAAVTVLARRTRSDAAESAGTADLAVVPCVPMDERDSALARSVARIAALDLAMFARLQVRSSLTSFHWWSRAGNERDAARAAAALHARRVAACVLARPTPDTLEARLELVDESGSRMPLPGPVRGPAVDPPQALGDSIALALFQRLGRTLSSSGISALGGHPVQAVSAFLRGEEAFEAGDWALADTAYAAALAIEPGFGLARWRLSDAHRWELTATDVDLRELLETDGAGLPPEDRRLLEARVTPSGPAQFAIYDEVLRDYPRDAYATMLFADDLFHRGSLWGVPLDSAEHVLELAVARDSFFQPAWDEIAQIRIRLGRREPAARAIEHLEALSSGSGGEDALQARVLAQAWLERFEPDSAPAGRTELFGARPDPAVLLHWTRLAGPTLDLARAERGLGAALVGVSGTWGRARVSGHLAQGLALMAEGRTEPALAQFDTAGALTGQARGEVQAAEWRVVSAALDIPGVPDDQTAAARARLRLVARSASTRPVARREAAWALALDAYRHRNVQDGDRWAASVGEPAPDSVGGRLRILLAAVRRAGEDDPAGALELSGPLLAYDSAAALEAPFARSALHLLRGDWFDLLNRPAEALASLTWHENSDFEGAPGEVRYAAPLVQAGEVDWALGTEGRLRAAEAALEAGETVRACRYATEALRLWRNAGTALIPRVSRARAVAGRACSR